MKMILFLLAGFFFSVSSAIANDQSENPVSEVSVSEAFSGYDRTSQLVIDHSAWTLILKSTVLRVGRSKSSSVSQKPTTFFASRITTGSTSPARYEGNRVHYQFMKQGDNVLLLDKYIEGMQNFPQNIQLSQLTRNQQLAYWLNLYNAIVYKKMVKEYPLTRLKNLKLGKGGTPSFWDEKAVTVQGVPLSLHDIEKILLDNWNSPLVIYGLYQGAIGGPRLLRYAFTGKKVWRKLKENAMEFINSSRGFSVSHKGTLKVSLLFEWMYPFFNNSERTLVNHLYEYADEAKATSLAGHKQVKFKTFDWYTTDLNAGTYHTGISQNYASALAIKENFLLNYVPVGGHKFGSLSPEVLNLARGVTENNIILLVPVITTIECAPDDPCGFDASQSDQEEELEPSGIPE